MYKSDHFSEMCGMLFSLSSVYQFLRCFFSAFQRFQSRSAGLIALSLRLNWRSQQQAWTVAEKNKNRSQQPGNSMYCAQWLPPFIPPGLLDYWPCCLHSGWLTQEMTSGILARVWFIHFLVSLHPQRDYQDQPSQRGGWWLTPAEPAFGGWRWEKWEFKASLTYIVKPSLKIKSNVIKRTVVEMVAAAHTLNPSTLQAEAGGALCTEATLVYTANQGYKVRAH